MARYLKREQYFANRYTRLLHKTCAAQYIGADGASLCICIAMVEDSKRYSGPVTFHNTQLLSILGFAKWERLDRARQLAMKFGWLHYDAPSSGSRQPGVYWVTIPPELEALNDAPFDEGTSPQTIEYRRGYADGFRDAKEGKACPESVSLSGIGLEKAYPDQGYGEGVGEGVGEGEPSNLSLNPAPKKSRRTPFTDEDMATAKWMFELLKGVDPTAKEPDVESWANTIRLMRERDNRSDGEIRTLFAWTSQHSFWGRTIYSPTGLRRNWQAANLQMIRPNGTQNAKPKGTGQTHDPDRPIAETL
jgi:hypothetical protein